MIDLKRMKKLEKEPLGSADFRPETFRLPAQERPVAPERPAWETGDVAKASRLSDESEKVRLDELVPQNKPTPVAMSLYQEEYRKLEMILEDGLADFYFRMSPLEQQKFKSKGEETTLEIIKLTAKPKFQIKKVVELIKNWLKLLPGVNRFFLEQTAKIKADKIIAEIRKRPRY